MECPKCHAKLQWGLSDSSFDKRTGLVKAGDIILCGCIIEEKNYYPMCSALVWTVGEQTNKKLKE